MLYFITGNKKKFFEASQIMPKLKQLDISLPEIQELDIKKIIVFKLKQAFLHHKGPFLIEDSGVCLGALGNKLPGPLAKWFNDTIGPDGYFKLAKKFKNFKAFAVTIVAYAQNAKNIKFFEGRVNGTVVKPRGQYRFGYDEILVPNGSKFTLSELKAGGNFTLSPRGLAFRKLKDYLYGKAKIKRKAKKTRQDSKRN